MSDSSAIHIDESGIVRVGQSRVLLDDIISAYRKSHSRDLLIGCFPTLTREELHAAMEYYLSSDDASEPRGPAPRDADWKQWNSTVTEDWGTYTPPNTPMQNR